MTRAEIAAHYVIVNGRIRSPGKFEGEPVWAPHAYELWLEGLRQTQQELHPDCVWLRVLPEDRSEFPEISAGAYWLQVCESDQGFVYCNELDEGGQPL